MLLLTLDGTAFIVNDEGRGFDHSKVLKKHEDGDGDVLSPHGRGITMALSIFYHLKYNKRGSQVMLIKSLKQEEEKKPP